MVQSLYTLLYKIIDYAGMFPPANLELEEAFQNFKILIQCNVINSSKLNELFSTFM